MRRRMAALLLLLVGGSLLLATACGGGGATKVKLSGTVAQTPPGQKVTSARPLPTVSTAPYLSLGSFQFLDAKTGWLSASSCRDQPRPTPDERRNAPIGPPTCKSSFYGTTDGGQTWSLLSHDGVGPFVMDGSGTGLAAGGFCDSPCNNSVLRTTDGGRHWSQTYTSTLWLADLTFIDGEAWLVGDSCGPSDGGSCERYLLKSSDGGLTWSQTPLPITGFGISISRPTKHDAWMASSSYGAHAQPAKILVTHDGARTWTSLPHPTGYAVGGEIAFRTTQQGWLLISGLPGAGNQAKDLFGTEDGGATWTHLSGSIGPEGLGGSGTAGYAGPLLFTSAQDGWIALARRGLIHSADGGLHWAYVNVDAGAGEVRPVVQFTDALHGWTVSDYYLEQPPLLQLEQALWATSDGGATWQKVPLPAPESP